MGCKHSILSSSPSSSTSSHHKNDNILFCINLRRTRRRFSQQNGNNDLNLDEALNPNQSLLNPLQAKADGDYEKVSLLYTFVSMFNGYLTATLFVKMLLISFCISWNVSSSYTFWKGNEFLACSLGETHFPSTSFILFRLFSFEY